MLCLMKWLSQIKQEIKYYNDIGYSVFYNDQIEEIKQNQIIIQIEIKP